MTTANLPSPSHSAEITSDVLENTEYTHVRVSQFLYTWTIDNFSSCRETLGEKLRSLQFPDKPENGIEWALLLYPKGNHATCKNYLSLFLCLLSCETSEVQVNCKLSILNAAHEKAFTLEFDGLLKIFDTLGFPHFVPWEYVISKENELLSDDKLAIHCEINATLESTNIQKLFPPPKCKCTFSRDFGLLYDSQKFSDVTFVVGDIEFKGHKAILSARSSVFEAMFEENIENRVEIKTINAQIFGEVFRYIYTGKVLNLETLAEQLLDAANMFQLEGLHLLCEKVLKTID